MNYYDSIILSMARSLLSFAAHQARLKLPLELLPPHFAGGRFLMPPLLRRQAENQQQNRGHEHTNDEVLKQQMVRTTRPATQLRPKHLLLLVVVRPVRFVGLLPRLVSVLWTHRLVIHRLPADEALLEVVLLPCGFVREDGVRFVEHLYVVVVGRGDVGVVFFDEGVILAFELLLRGRRGGLQDVVMVLPAGEGGQHSSEAGGRPEVHPF